jgi:hypothetical protein
MREQANDNFHCRQKDSGNYGRERDPSFFLLYFI